MKTKSQLARAACAWLIGASAAAGAFAQTTTGSGSALPCTDAVNANGVTSGALGSPSTQLGSSTTLGARAGTGLTPTPGTSAMGSAGSTLPTPSSTLNPTTTAPGSTTLGPNVANTTSPALNGSTTIAGNAAAGAALQPSAGCR